MQLYLKANYLALRCVALFLGMQTQEPWALSLVITHSVLHSYFMPWSRHGGLHCYRGSLIMSSVRVCEPHIHIIYIICVCGSHTGTESVLPSTLKKRAISLSIFMRAGFCFC